MKLISVLLFTALSSVAQTYSLGTNFSADLKGVPDNRADTWGDADYVVKAITFKPPQGYRVRIIRAYGDFLVWPIGKVEPGRFAGVLFGLQTTAPEGSIRADWAADNTMLYIQDATGGEARRAPFNFDTSAGGLLEDDHKLLVKMAVWLNDTGLFIHMEPSFVLVYRYEKKNDNHTSHKQVIESDRPVVSDYGPLGTGKSGILRIPARP